MKALFTTTVLLSQEVAARVKNDPHFAFLCGECAARHFKGDWGVVCAEDKAQNDASVKSKGMILSAYTIDPAKGESKGFGENTLWIITDPGHAVTTLLFPDEY